MCVQVAYHERIQAQCQEVAGSPYIVPSTSLTCTHMTKRRPHLRLAPVKVEELSILFIVNLYLLFYYIPHDLSMPQLKTLTPTRKE